MDQAEEQPAGVPMPAAPDPDPVQTQTEKLDRENAREALRKLQAGDKPTSREASALRRYEKREEERRRWSYYRSIPKGHWQTMSGRQVKVLNEQAERFGMPTGDRTVDLVAFLRWFHQFLADNRTALTTMLNGDDPALQNSEDRMKRIKADREQMKLDQERGLLVDREVARQGLAKLAGILRNTGEVLRDQFGEEARLVMEEGLADYEQALENGEGGV